MVWVMIDSIEQAESIAKKLWGDQGFAIVLNKNNAKLFLVGERNGPVRQPYGRGNSWEQAFSNAKINLN